MRHRGLGMLAALSAYGLLAPMPVISQAEPKQAARQTVAATSRKESRLNRSKHWPHAETYQEARDLSPFPDRPVR